MKRVLFPLLAVSFVLSAIAAEKTKVACIGDSITFGYGLQNRNEDSYPAQLHIWQLIASM